MTKFRHRNCEKFFAPATFAYELPPSTTFGNMLLLSKEFVTFPFGMALVHPKDNYYKKVGRENALKQIGFQQFKVAEVSIRNNRTIFELRAYNIRGKVVVVVVSLDFPNGKARLEDIRIY